MTKKLYETPKNWLTLDVCARLFEIFSERLRFDEPIPPFDTRFKGKLEGILNSVSQTYDGKQLNSNVLDAASAYFNQLVRGHAFQNGNKRLAVLFTHFFLLSHDIDFTLDYKEMYHFAVTIALVSETGITAERTKRWAKLILKKFTEEREAPH